MDGWMSQWTAGSVGARMVNQVQQSAICRAEVADTLVFTVKFFSLSACLQIFIKRVEKVVNRDV